MLMRKFLLSLLMVISTMFAIAASGVTYGSQEDPIVFAADGNEQISGCVGTTMTIYFQSDNGIDQYEYEGGSSGSLYETASGSDYLEVVLESAGMAYYILHEDVTGNTMQLGIDIKESLADGVQITTTETEFKVDNEYTFVCLSNASDITYEWTIEPVFGAEFIQGTSAQTCSIKFTEPNIYIINCAISNGGCESSNQVSVQVTGGSSLQTITYSAQPQSFCSSQKDSFDFEVTASDMLDEGTYTLFAGNYSVTGRIEGTSIYFEISDWAPGFYNVTVTDSEQNELVTSTITIVEVVSPTIFNNDGNFYTNTSYTFENENYSQAQNYAWYVDGGDYSFENVEEESSSVSIKFMGMANYTITCATTDKEGVCADFPKSDVYSLTVSEQQTQTAVCSINGTEYSTLTEALNAVQSDDEILVLNDIDEGQTAYVSVNKSFTLNTNNHVVSFGQISGMASRTITGGGVLNTALENSNTNGSNTLTIDNATLNLNGSQWMAKGMISLVNGASVTLTNDIFLGGGDEDGFNLSIDETSSFNVNGQNISGYNYARIADQMSPYMPANYTVSASQNGLVFSPDANVILGAQPQQIERTYYIYGKAIACSGENASVQIVAPQGFADLSSLMVLSANQDQILVSVLEDTLVLVNDLPVGSYRMTDNGATVFEFSVEEETITATITGPTTATVDEEVTYSVTASSTLPNTILNYSWGGGVENSLESDLVGVGSFSTSDIGEAEVFCLVESENGCTYEAKLSVTVEEATPQVSYWATNTVFCSNQIGYVTIESSESIDPAAFAVMSPYNESVDAVVSADEANKATIEYSKLFSGTYTITSKGESVGSFNVVVNQAPRAWFDCPTETEAVVGETWNVSAPTVEGATYNYMWSSDGISFGDPTSVRQAVTYETAGSVWVVLSMENTETGCVGNSDTCRFTILEIPIEYTVDNVSVCAGTDEAVAVINASGSIYGRTVTVRDEDDNTSFPEYNDDNDAATVYLNHLSVGTYTYKVYEDDVYKTEFTVTVNSLPRAYIECPTNPVVGDIWSPNTATQEGMTYQWYSDNISSLDGATACCPQVTFSEAGSFSATLVVKNNETGCLSEGATCEFTVSEDSKSVYFLQETYEIENGTPTTICLTAEGFDLANAQITYTVSNEKNLSVEPSAAASGCAVVTAYDGTTETQQLDASVVVGGRTYTATADIHIVEPFVCEGTIIEGGTHIDLSFDEMAVGDEYRLVMSGTSAFTGVINIMVEDFEAPATTSRIISKMGENLESYYNFDVYEGEPFEINTLIEIDKSVSSTSHNYKLYVLPMPNNCPTGYDELGSPVCNGKLCQTYYSFVKEENFECNGNQVYQLTLNGIEDAQSGDKYTIMFSGTPSFDGDISIVAVNRVMGDTSADWSDTPISEIYTFSVTNGQQFDYTQDIEITQSIASESGSNRVLVIWDDETQPVCVTNIKVAKATSGKNFTLSESQFSMTVGGTKQLYLLADGNEYYGDVEWSVYDLSGSTAPCVSVDYGEVTALSAGQAKIEAQVNGTVVATAMVSVNEFTCNGTLYSVTEDNAYFTVKTSSEIVAGETYRVELEGTADFDGAVMVTCGDFSSEEPGQAAGMGEIAVQAGVPFTYASMLTIQATASSTPNYKFMIALLGDNDEARLCATKLEFSKFEAKYTLDAQNEIYVGTGKMLTLRNIDGSVYSGEATWASSNPNVASVEKGYVYGVTEGVTEIQAYIGDELAATATVLVVEGSGVGMWFDEAGYTLNVGENLPICVQLYGMDFPDVTYSYDESVIELNAATTGWGGASCKTIKGLKAGSTMLRASAEYDGETYTASAIIEVKGGSTSDDYTLAFAQSKYEITEGESISACLTIGDGFENFNPQFNFDQTVISIANPTDGSDCGTVTALSAGHTFVEVVAEAPDGKFYTAQTEVIVNAKQLPYFVKQSIAIEVGESEQIEVMSFDGGPAQASLFTFETSDATVATVGRNGVVTAVATGNAEVSVFFEGTLVGKVAVVVDAAPQMPTPGYNTNVLTMCFDKSATANGGMSLEGMVYPTSDFGKLKWYDASGNELSVAPVVSAAQAGKAVYYVSQVGMGDMANYRESEKVPYTVEIVYVAEPKLNVADQSTCQGAMAIPFVAATDAGNTVEWTDVTGMVVSQGAEFLPQVPASGYYTYKVTAKNMMGCVSNPLTVTYTVGNAVKPEIFVATQAESFVVGEPVTLGTSNQMSDEYSVVWSLGDNEYVHGTAFTTQFDEVGTYTVTCKVVETNTGCADSASKVITVEERVVPLQSIVVEPETVTLYEGEQGYVSLAFEPSYASNMAYTIEVEDTEVADVAGLTVWAVAEGTTKATITSVENPDVKAEFNIVVNKLIKAKEISMPNIITLALNEETKVAASVIPAEASYNKVAFKEKADNVISIDAQGNIKALGEGTSTIVAYSNGGLQATAVVYVTAAQTAITDVAVPDEIELKLRDSVVVSYKVTPVTLAAKLLEWAIENNDIATFSNGVVKAVSAGETNLTVSIGNISKTIKITVTTSSAPVIGVAPKLAFEQGKNITVDFADFVSDDETELANLTFEAASDDLNVSIDGTVATITAKSDSYAGTTSFTLSVTDSDGLSTSADVPVEVTEIANKAPIILIEDVQIKYNACTYLNLSEIASDDFTSYKKLIFKFEAENVTLDVIRSRKYQLRMYTDDPDMEFDTLFVTVTDDAGLSTSAKIIMYVNSLPNRAPKIAEIPVQSETDDAAFGTIELANYVKDDYTAASSIKWTTSSSDNLSVTIDEGVASVEVLNAFWNGAEAITFYAADEDGLKDSTIVYYSRKVTINEETVSSGSDNELTPVVWEGAPVVNIMAMKFIGVPGEQFIIMASLSGYDCTWAWEIEGANGIDQTSLMQMVSFDNPGTYTVKLTVQSADGQHSIEVVKENLLTVVGINERTPAICKGDAVTLTASEGLDSYYWSTGDVKNTTTARPDATTLYKLTMKKGMFTLVDTVTVKVSVPVALMEDSVMCAGTTFDLEAIGDYVSYAWNTGDVEKSITIPSEVASYTVTAVDGMQCVSVDTFNLTKVNDLPAIDLGEDQTPCDGTTVTLDAGAGYEYLWSTGATSQTIDLTANTETVWARIIDANKCINYDTVVVAFTYPYPEQIGVATFSQTTDHIILAWEKTAGVNTAKYRIERETNVTDNWEQVGDDVMFSEAGIVVDEDVNYKKRAYKYRLVTTDGCGNEAVSEVHRSMISTTTRNDDGTKTLQWCAYEPMSNVTQYLVLRGYDATKMDTVDQVPASNMFEIWNETESQFVNDENIKYRVVFRLKSEVNENAVNTLDGQPVEGYYTKAESGPFSLAMSNIAEVETDVSVSEIAFPADVIVYPTTVSSYINVAISSPEDSNFIVEVLNANGQVVAKVQTGEISKTLLQISAEGLRQGVYTVRISDGQQSTSVKVVK